MNFLTSSMATAEAEGITVVGIDNMNDYYEVSLKEYRLEKLRQYPNFVFLQMNIADKAAVNEAFATYKPAVVVNLAAQAGVRYSISHPDVYIESNLIGFYNLLAWILQSSWWSLP